MQNFLLHDFVVVDQRGTGQPAIWPLENPHWGGGRNVCCPFWHANEDGRHVTSWANWQEGKAGVKEADGRSGAMPALPLRTHRITAHRRFCHLLLSGPLPSAASVTLTCAPYTTIRTSAKRERGRDQTEPNGRLAFMTVDMHCMLIMCWVDRHASARLPARVPWKWSLPESHHI